MYYIICICKKQTLEAAEAALIYMCENKVVTMV